MEAMKKKKSKLDWRTKEGKLIRCSLAVRVLAEDVQNTLERLQSALSEIAEFLDTTTSRKDIS